MTFFLNSHRRAAHYRRGNSRQDSFTRRAEQLAEKGIKMEVDFARLSYTFSRLGASVSMTGEAFRRLDMEVRDIVEPIRRLLEADNLRRSVELRAEVMRVNAGNRRRQARGRNRRRS